MFFALCLLVMCQIHKPCNLTEKNSPQTLMLVSVHSVSVKGTEIWGGAGVGSAACRRTSIATSKRPVVWQPGGRLCHTFSTPNSRVSDPCLVACHTWPGAPVNDSQPRQASTHPASCPAECQVQARKHPYPRSLHVTHLPPQSTRLPAPAVRPQATLTRAWRSSASSSMSWEMAVAASSQVAASKRYWKGSLAGGTSVR